MADAQTVEAARIWDSLDEPGKDEARKLISSGADRVQAVMFVQHKRTAAPASKPVVEPVKTEAEAREVLAKAPADVATEAALVGKTPIHAATLIRAKRQATLAGNVEPEPLPWLRTLAVGAGEGATGGNLAGAAALMHPIEGQTFEQTRAKDIEDLAALREQQPKMMLGGEAIGVAAPMGAGALAQGITRGIGLGALKLTAPAVAAAERAAALKAAPSALAKLGILGREGLAAGGAYGGAYGAMGTEKGTLGDVAGSTAGGAFMGSLLGGGLMVAPTLASKAAGPFVRGAANVAEKMGAKAADRRILTSVGGVGGGINAPKILLEADKVPGGREAVAQTMRETGISRGPFVTPAGIAKKAAQVGDEVQQIISDTIAASSANGKDVSGAAVAQGLIDKAGDIQRGAGGYQHLDPGRRAMVDSLVETATRYRGRGAMTMREAQDRIAGPGGLAERAYRGSGAREIPLSAEGKAARSTVEGLREQMGLAAEKLGGNAPESVTKSALFKGRTPTAAEAYKEAKRVSQVADFVVGPNAEDTLARMGKNRAFGLMDTQVGGLGAAVAEGASAPQKLGAVAFAIAARKLAAAYGAGMRASAAETAQALARALRAEPRALGKYSPTIQAAAQAAAQNPDAEQPFVDTLKRIGALEGM